MQDEVFPDREHFGRIFFNQARLSAQGIPQLAAVLGSCTAGGAYVPAMCDEAIIVRKQGTIFLGGPPLVKAATGEVVDAETLGGGDVHARISGVADYLVKNDDEALDKMRELVSNLNRQTIFQCQKNRIRQIRFTLRTNCTALSRVNFAIRSIFAKSLHEIVDGSLFQEFKALYGPTIVCGFAHIHGLPVGIVANNGILFSEAAQKGAHFIQLCNRRRVPLVFLQNIAGFMVGKKFEHGGIAKDGAKMVNAVATATVPKFTVIIGGSFGAGNYAMCGRAYAPRMMWMWPNARISVMGGEQAALVLTTVKREGMQARGEPWSERDEKNYARRIARQYDKQGHPYYASSRLWDDGVIDPVDTRRTLGQAIAASQYRPDDGESSYGVFRM